MHAKSLQSCLTLCDPMDCSHQAPLPMGFSRQEHWSGLPCPPPGGLPNPWVEHTSLTSPALAGSLFTTNATWEAQMALVVKSLPTGAVDSTDVGRSLGQEDPLEKEMTTHPSTLAWDIP